MEWLARSADPEKGQAAQSYARHVFGVRALLERFVQAVSALLPVAFFALLAVAFRDTDCSGEAFSPRTAASSSAAAESAASSAGACGSSACAAVSA